ncbi:hypothetical protein [Leptolyngbya sp. FACHB-261]|uniref:hypothetical protein n=1 Tax=Leptolyngbya sp. FACHB-261 TaxID=2692806 RepID=UPI0016845A3C|nr:hypothetical protein [Leptolyngbya sp. FACHB-261]MBD2104840.1 hypothetical protein [Leptolyngbya sp. FACHB-261]
MGRLNPFSLQMQITRMFEQGQSFFAPPRVEAWLREHNHNPSDYEILFHQEVAPPGASSPIQVRIELRRRDGQPVDEWLQAEVNRQS